MNRRYQACLSLMLLGLVSACSTEFPESVPLGGQSDSLPARQTADAQPEDMERNPVRPLDASILDAAPFEPPDALVRDMEVTPPPNGRECTHDWPEVCQIDCDNEPDPSALLYVAEAESFVPGFEIQRYECVVVAGTLTVVERAAFEVGTLVIEPTGRIDGRGGGGGFNAAGRGRSGTTAQGRGEGGGGGSGVCRGGNGGSLTDGTNGASAGETSRDLGQPGGFGGRGGGQSERGAQGGTGGASLQVRAHRCLLRGVIDLGGAIGQMPLNSAGGGGGGGAGGNLDLNCRHVEVETADFLVRLDGASGGRGGSVNNGMRTLSGSGGGGGAAGAFRLVAISATVDGQATPSADAFRERTRNLIRQTGGPGGEPGLGGEPREAGRQGQGCSQVVEISAL